ncbi:Protein phosphatase methylesterase 1 [Blastosporella zonata]|nr:Protein phosphatase methylesterase 1 [Blastosporella zonata]
MNNLLNARPDGFNSVEDAIEWHTFLQARTGRILILAGADRLDNELMIGQMQGKFQMVVIPGVGHMLQEDNPRRLAEIMVEFWRRNDRVVVGVKKVGDA